METYSIGLAPQHLSDLLSQYESIRPLRSWKLKFCLLQLTWYTFKNILISVQGKQDGAQTWTLGHATRQRCRLRMQSWKTPIREVGTTPDTGPLPTFVNVVYSIKGCGDPGAPKQNTCITGHQYIIWDSAKCCFSGGILCFMYNFCLWSYQNIGFQIQFWKVPLLKYCSIIQFYWVIYNLRVSNLYHLYCTLFQWEILYCLLH